MVAGAKVVAAKVAEGVQQGEAEGGAEGELAVLGTCSTASARA